MAAQTRVVFYIVAISYLINISNVVANEGGPEFSYTGPTGPDKWGSLSPAYSACSEGRSQSPVDVVRNKAAVNTKLTPLIRRYNHSAAANFLNNGFNVEIDFGPNSGRLEIDGKAYELEQLHWHTPSEHRFDGVQYDAELHLVHAANSGDLAVVAKLYQIGEPDPFLAMVENELKELVRVANVTLEAVEASQLVGNNSTEKHYYTYPGSLTTPPCSEIVTWFILHKVSSISREQVTLLKAPLRPDSKNNSRPLQPLNGRLVHTPCPLPIYY